MNRRHFLQAAPLLVAPALLRAHHGWSSFDTARPLYVAGTIHAVRWQNPHAELQLDVPAGLVVPSDFTTRTLPAQQAAVDGPALLRAAQPVAAGRWELELAPLGRLRAWGLEPPLAAGDRIEALGYAAPDVDAGRTVRVEFLFARGRSYGLRSAPAS